MPTIRFSGTFDEAITEILRYLRSRNSWNEIHQAKFDGVLDAGIHSFDALYALIKDDTAEITLRKNALSILGDLVRGIHQVHSRTVITFVDKRRAFPSLAHALKHPELHVSATETLGSLGHRGAIPLLSHIALDRSEIEEARMWAISGISYFHYDEHAEATLMQLAFDETEPDIARRSEAIEQVSYFLRPDLLESYVNLLKSAEADVRFWCAYGLACNADDIDLSPYLVLIDSIVAHDDVVCEGWWHAGRELAPALEHIYAKQLGLDSSYKRLISPRLEYFDVLTPPPIEEPSLHIDPDWLAEKLRERWTDIHINIRDPKPQTMSLDWFINRADFKLMGGLHRDRYGVFITGDSATIKLFCTWYRSIIPAEHPLRRYEWAERGVKL